MSLAAANLTCADLFTEPGARDVVVAIDGDSTVVLRGNILLTPSATADGVALPNARFRFTSSDEDIVSAQGQVMVGVALGSAVITVELVSSALPSAPPSDTVTIRVIPGAVVLDSSAVTLRSLGDTVRVAASVLDADSQVVSTVVQWSSTDTAVATVNAIGRLTARGNGQATVIANAFGRADSVAVTVQQVLHHYTFSPAVVFLDALAVTANVNATGRDARGNAMTGVAPVFTSRDTTVASVGAGSGVVTSLINGQTYVVATRGTVQDSVAVTVDQRATQVFIQPDPIPAITSIGAQVQLTARAFDRNAVEIQGFTPAWFTLDPARVTISSGGLVTGQSAGTARIIASLDGVNDTNSVVISNTPVTVSVTPDTANATSVGDTVVYSAVVLNGLGDSIASAGVTWSTPDTGLVNVLPNGRAITLATGFARVIAQAGSRADTGFVLITNQVAFVNIGPATRTLSALADVDTPAVSITNARGDQLARSSVNWTSDDQAIARVNAQGHIIALDTGVTFIRATSANGFFKDSVQYTIQNVPTSLVLGGRAADTLTLLGQVLVYPVEVRNRRNALIPNYPVLWRSTNVSVVDTVPHDSATAIGFGSTMLIAEAVAGVADTALLAVVNLTRLQVDNSVVVPAGTPRTGTGSRPYAKIQDAVTAADANDTVFIRRGLGSYSETVALSKRLTLLGDSGDPGAANTYLGNNRDPNFLPLIAHDTGGTAIFAHTTAPQTIRYLAVRHTLDGPAIDADGSDVAVEYFYVNPPGTVSSRVGRGLSFKNSPSGTSVNRSNIRSVRGYGIRLENVQGAGIRSDSIIGVDSVAGVEPGAAVSIVGGGTIAVVSNLLREAQGPLVSANATAALRVDSNLTYGRQTHILLDNLAPTASTAIRANAFDMRMVTGNDGLVSSIDGRAAILMRNTVGTTILPLIVQNNSFVDSMFISPVGFTGGLMDAVHVKDSRGAVVSVNTFKGMRFAVRAANATNTQIIRAVADSISSLVSAEGLDTLILSADTVRLATSSCISSPVNVGNPPVAHDDPSFISIQTSRFERCSSASPVMAVNVSSNNGTPDLTMGRTTILSFSNGAAVQFDGGDLSLDSNTITASTLAGDTSRFSVSGFTPAVNIAGATTANVTRNVIMDFSRRAGLRLTATNSLTFGGNRITRNGRGFFYQGNGSGAATTSFFVCGLCGAGRRANSVFDNDTLGFAHSSVSGTFPDSIWWGDGRGPRNGPNFSMTGDSVSPGTVVFTNSDAPLDTGVTAVGMRIIRGNNRTAPAGSALLPQLTVRVVDADGKPVPNVDVTFTVTAGGGNFAGPTVLNRTTNSDGLAEVNLTLGNAPGTNTVSVSGTTLNLGTVIFTATGT